ncbi:bifunctional MaoC family dehydratase N-terminal/OB-fold nucleic acid binding domain-containing protein [Nocardia arthritidis]|uniref:DNA-binding protein n=1 Tax=Nocardia arthritidis TaxID=228602 RepID=A0A6G9Y5R1_9NOCA|nr:bifunctional MaoC family dehydratase N-terminal/OB-fold nucleic acid binding domain-containing protein [Nocardia arthritidis]QIS08427.1 DNA-binding protein [Nocardia arthritidis]
MPETLAPEAIMKAAGAIMADGDCPPRLGRDPVNQPMINNWVEAIGDTNPIYVDEAAARAAGHPGIVAPPAMAQVWTMPGLNRSRPESDPMDQTFRLLDSAGYTSVVATDYQQTYHRYLQVGEQVSVVNRLSDIRGPKRTALGEGWFITFQMSWKVGDEVVVEMLFRMLKFAPGTAQAPSGERVKPLVSLDTEFFWEGTKLGELRIQRLPDGSLRHPPIPALWLDKSETTDYLVASGRGTVFSYVVHHAPKVPGRQLPFVVALVELEEGVRMLGELRGVDPGAVEIGLPVRVVFEKLDDTGALPYWVVEK